jgi:hypothetical protein
MELSSDKVRETKRRYYLANRERLLPILRENTRRWVQRPEVKERRRQMAKVYRARKAEQAIAAQLRENLCLGRDSEPLSTLTSEPNPSPPASASTSQCPAAVQ